VLVSFTDFTFARWRVLPQAWLAAMRLRRAWPELEGAVGLMLWVKPLSRRSGSISLWRSDADLRRFVGSPQHAAIVRRHRPHMSGVSASWRAERVAIADALAEGRRRVLDSIRGPASAPGSEAAPRAPAEGPSQARAHTDA
jgi:hypothetical protein